MTIADAIDAFGRGFSYTRSFTHPYEFVRVGPLWVMRDGPRTSGDVRNQEILASGIDPKEAMKHVREYLTTPDAPVRYGICAIEPMDADHEAIKTAYKAGGYRLLRREPFFLKSLEAEIPAGDPRIVRVDHAELADRVATAVGRRQIRPHELAEDDSPLRLYVAMHGDQPIGWVRSVAAGSASRWVSNLFVHPEHRRKGLASALMRAMLHDDRRLGWEHSVLLASNAGSHLYPTLGYRQIGLLQIFTPIRR